MEFLDSVPQQYTGVAGLVFTVLVVVYAAYSQTIGKKQAPKIQEFGFAGQLADMGPIKELIEGVGLLVQQQVRTNIHLERCAVAMEKATAAYEGHLAAEATQEEIEEKAQLLFERRLAEQRPVRRRRPARKNPPA